jgi:adenosylcobinamide-GDP ribazoletransferase
LTPKDSQRQGINPVLLEIRLFFTALMFYTRLPCPRWTGYSGDQLNRSTRYFPAIGWVVGGAVAVITGLLSLILPVALAVVVGVSCGVLLTGAFHEDGFADVCDGFGGGHTPERVLEIMKDSRIGAYGAIGLILLFAVKLCAMTFLVAAEPWYGLVGIVFAHVLSRFSVVTLIYTDKYARSDLTSKIKPIGRKISTGGLVVSFIWLLPFVGLLWERPWWFLAVPVALLVRLFLGKRFKAVIGGYTGDCLGCAQQSIEVFVYLSILAALGASMLW